MSSRPRDTRQLSNSNLLDLCHSSCRTGSSQTWHPLSACTALCTRLHCRYPAAQPLEHRNPPSLSIHDHAACRESSCERATLPPSIEFRMRSSLSMQSRDPQPGGDIRLTQLLGICATS